jgi:hypothetical protein
LPKPVQLRNLRTFRALCAGGWKFCSLCSPLLNVKLTAY